jgi:hypothetical protein
MSSFHYTFSCCLEPAGLLFSLTAAPSSLCYNTSALFCVAHNTQMLLLLVPLLLL